MKRDDRIKIDIISGIDEHLVDDVTAQRIKYSSSPRHAIAFMSKKFFAFAASILLIVSAIITALIMMLGRTPPPIDTRKVPVYKGMTVSLEAPVPKDPTAALLWDNDDETFYSPLAATVNPNIEHANRELYEKVTRPKGLYYAKPNEDIYITVHIENPDEFEILSFTLNGTKYSSYMFEDGSDLENLVLKVNVGDVSGLISYTIDAIKYVDGEEIKDVKMDGDKTVNVGVYNNIQPKAKITDITYDTLKLSFTPSVTDTEGVIAYTDGKIYAVLYKNSKIFSKYEIGLESAPLSFDLDGQGYYEYAVVAVYDAYDGKGKVAHTLTHGSFSNEVKLDVVFTGLTNERAVTFDITTYNDYVKIDRFEVLLVDGYTTVASSDNTRARYVILPDRSIYGTAFIRVHCSYTVNGKTETCKFYSQDFSIPKTPIVGEVLRWYDRTSPYYDEVLERWQVHEGIDFIPTTSDLNVYSATEGTVLAVNKDEKAGATVEIVDPAGFVYVYKYLETSVAVEVGDKIKMGDIIGTMGSFPEVAEGADGPHLHVEVHKNSKIIPPPFLLSNEAAADHELKTSKLLKTASLSGTDSVSVEINTVGQRFADVTLEYTSDCEFMTVEDGRLVFDLSSLPDGSVTVTITVKAICADAEKTTEHTVEITKS